METIYEVVKTILAAIGCGVIWMIALVAICTLIGLLKTED